MGSRRARISRLRKSEGCLDREASVIAMNEQRKYQRRRLLKAGTISINRTGVIDCSVRNLSSAGACLEVASPIGIPDDFVLVTRDDHIEHPCHVVWRTEKRIGVAFD